MFQSKSLTLVREKFRYTDLRWARFLIIPGLVAFSLLLVLWNVKHQTYYKKDKNFTKFREGVGNLQDFQYIKVNDCVLQRSNEDVSKLNANIAKVTNHCNHVQLKLKSCQFPNGVMHKYWITGKFLIRFLQIDSCTLSEIELGSFEGAVFNKIEKLELINVNLKRADENIFKGLNILQHLVLSAVNQDFVLKTNFLKYASSTLINLSIETNKSTTAIKPQDLLGAEELQKIENVVLNGNNFGNLIDKDSFNVIKRTKGLSLQNCEITSLEAGIFDSMAKTIILLNLSNNKIKMLHPSYFKSLLPFHLKGILLANNPIDCSCELSSFVEFYKIHRKKFDFNIMCKTPPRNEGENIRNAVLCIDEKTKIETKGTVPIISTTLMTSITTTTTTTTEGTKPIISTNLITTKATVETIPITSIIATTTKRTTPIISRASATTTDSTTTKDSTTSISRISRRATTKIPFPGVIRLHCTKNKSDDYLQVKSTIVQFSVETISSTGVKLTVMKFQGQYSVLWFQNASMKFEAMEMNYNDYALGCNTKIKREIIIEKLKQAVTYVFCLIKVGEIQISPFNCQSHYLPDDSENNVSYDKWYLWGSLSGTIAFIIVGALLSIAFGGIFAFYIINWKPTLIKGSKRVLVVNKSCADILVFPRSSNVSGTTTATTDTTVSNDSVAFRNNRLCRSKSEGSIVRRRSYMTSSNLYAIVH